MSAKATLRPASPSFSAAKTWAGVATRADDRWALLVTGLVALDAAAVGAAFALAYLMRFKAGIPLLEMPPHRLAFYRWVTLWTVPIWLGIFALYRLYDRRCVFEGLREYIQIVNACMAGTIAVVVISFLDTTPRISRGWLLLTWLLAAVLVSGGRFAMRQLLRALHRRGRLLSPIAIVGVNEEAMALAEQFSGNPGAGRPVLGFIDTSLPAGTHVMAGLSVLGRLDDLAAIVHQHRLRDVVIATTALTREQLLDLFRTFGTDETLELHLSSGVFEILTTAVQVREISCVPLMTPRRVRITGADAALKAALDYIVAACGLVLLLPLFLLLGLLIKLDSPGPVFHRRRVLGRSGKIFDALKFRTMVQDADSILAANPRLRQAFAESYKLKVDPRVTRIGAVLRRTSLDELPQLINVLRGEMSLVGPRMISPDEAVRYGKWQLNLLTVKPGITGPWQVMGRSDIPYQERVRLSMHYIRNYSIWLDLGMLLRTIPAVVRQRGAY